MSEHPLTLIQAILEEGSRRVREVLSKADEDARQLIQSGRMLMEKRDQEALQELEVELDRYKRRRRRQILSEVREKKERVQEACMKQVGSWVLTNLPELRRHPGYRIAVEGMWQEAVVSVDWERWGGTVGLPDASAPVLKVHPDDLERMQNIVGKNSRWEILTTDDAIDGGVELVLQSGKVRVLNTLRSRLTQGWPQWCPEIRKMLFDEGEECPTLS